MRGRAGEPVINLVFIGEAGHGKSTLMGRLLYELGEVEEASLERMRRVARELGDEGRFLAYIVDIGLEERRRGHSIEAMPWRPVRIGGKAIKMIDVPGVEAWINNAISGIAQADAAIVVVDVGEALRKGPGELRGLWEHLVLASAFEVGRLVVAINKMDAVGYDEGLFERASRGLRAVLEQAGYEGAEEIPFIPVSALRGDNVVEHSPDMAWYDGPALHEALGALDEPERPLEKPFRLPIYRYYERGNVAAGVVEAGVVCEGDSVLVSPPGAIGQITSMECWGERVARAGPREDVGMRIKGVHRRFLKKGFVVSHPESAPPVAKELVGRVRVLSPRGLWPGFCPIIYCHQARAPCRVEAVLRKLDPRTGDVVEEGPGSLSRGEVGDVLLRPLVPEQRGLVVEAHEHIPALGRFALRASLGSGRGSITVAIGRCLEVRPARA